MRSIKLLVSALLIACCLASFSQVMAFDLFSHCTTTTNSDGTKSTYCGPCKSNPNAPSCQPVGGGTKNPAIKIINDAANIIATVTGIAAVIFIILGGFTMITSAGNAEAVANARKRITYAVIGLVVVALAWTLISFVTDRLIK